MLDLLRREWRSFCCRMALEAMMEADYRRAKKWFRRAALVRHPKATEGSR